ncbi:MAG: TonB-dependent receptor [Bacteroidota bacterium]
MKKLISFLVVGNLLVSGVFAQEKDTVKTDNYFEMSLTELMNVQVISATKTEQQIRNVLATVQVITAEQIKTRSYFTLEEALSDLPGFQFRNILGYNSYVFMRGVPSQNNLILLLVDGVQINELNSGGFYAGGQFNLSDVERIEVVYGPASSLYGTNAVSGIINIVTKKPEGKHAGYISLLGGSFRTGMADFSFKNFNAKKNIGFSVSGMYKTSEKANLRGEEGDNNWTDEMENFENDFSLSARFQLKDFSAGVDYQEKWSSMTTVNKSIGEKSLDKNTLWDIAFINGFLKYAYQKNERLTSISTLYYRNATVKPNTIDYIEKATDTTPGQQIGDYRPNQLVGIEELLNYKAGKKLILTGGMVGEMEQLSDGFSISTSNSEFTKPPVPVKPDMLTNFLFSYYTKLNYQITNDLSFFGGIRHDFSSYYGQVLTPRTGLVFNKEKLTVKLLYGTAFRAPKPWDYEYGTGNDSLKPERMQSFELCGSYALFKNLSVGATIYKNLINDKLVKEITPTSQRWINKTELNTFGFELYGNYAIRALSIYANYTFNNSYDQDGIYIPEISMHTANAGITYSFGSHLNINIRTNYIGARQNLLIIPSTGNDIIEDAVLLNGCISYLNVKGFDFQLKINNILDQEYYHPCNRFAGRYRQPQRTILLKVIYSF